MASELPRESDLDLRPFPMLDGPPIPWYVAEAVYRHVYRYSQPLDRIAARGGFGWAEVAFMWSERRTTDAHRAACREAVARVA